MYLWNGRVHASETQKALELNTGRGRIKRLMEEAVAQHVEAIHYSATAGIQVRSNDGSKGAKDSGFWPSVLQSLKSASLEKNQLSGSLKSWWSDTCAGFMARNRLRQKWKPSPQ